ncbi:MAG TPA: hypothetical protein DIU37_04200 [Opitutae bacterium]|nr:hypothetical protein [Opitutae bacterium]|tara:strand:+ start:1031 stop:1426 length:396 start_codon:yes stop_codon:yes gene_type:complete
MKKSYPKLLVVALMSFASAFFMAGCTALLVGGAAAGTVAYVNGELKKTEDGTVKDLADATSDAFKNLGYKQISSNYDKTSGELIARTSTDDKVTVKLTKKTKDTTEVSIRVGTFGDQDISLSVLEAIEKEL